MKGECLTAFLPIVSCGPRELPCYRWIHFLLQFLGLVELGLGYSAFSGLTSFSPVRFSLSGGKKCSKKKKRENYIVRMPRNV